MNVSASGCHVKALGRLPGTVLRGADKAIIFLRLGAVEWFASSAREYQFLDLMEVENRHQIKTSNYLQILQLVARVEI
ncbi:hypothetical protein [Glutamicibacter arilaitensis]|uniref:hypothetical protein n=1 Tax=Glutamicibacter arilaitensis TaxID=256701 RepID=UPI003F917256